MLQKYTVSNFKYSSEFKLYDSSIPMYLQDRPHHVVKHCMQRMHAAKSDFKSEDIVQQSETVFSVKSKGASTNPDGTTKWWYYVQYVQLGNDHSFPKCECFDFERHYLACKHFLQYFL